MSPNEYSGLNDQKIFYSISEVSDLTQVPPYVLRYWEKEFRQLSPEKTNTGQRRYRKADIKIILMIRKLLYEEKYTTAGASKLIKEKLLEDKQLPLDLTDRRYEELIADLRSRLKTLFKTLEPPTGS